MKNNILKFLIILLTTSCVYNSQSMNTTLFSYFPSKQIVPIFNTYIGLTLAPFIVSPLSSFLSSNLASTLLGSNSRNISNTPLQNSFEKSIIKYIGPLISTICCNEIMIVTIKKGLNDSNNNSDLLLSLSLASPLAHIATSIYQEIDENKLFNPSCKSLYCILLAGTSSLMLTQIQFLCYVALRHYALKSFNKLICQITS